VRLAHAEKIDSQSRAAVLALLNVCGGRMERLEGFKRPTEPYDGLALFC
jgi:hypothetical protein